MPTLILNITKDEGSWAHCKKLIDCGRWDKVIAFCDINAQKNFSTCKEIKKFAIDFSKKIPELSEDMHAKLSSIEDLEVYVNFVSGSGREHMALISAILKSGLGMRLIVATADGVKEI